jgi:hypothetical protein
MIMKHFIFQYKVTLPVKIICNRWQKSQSVSCYSWDKVTCKGNNTGDLVLQRSALCELVLMGET